MALADKRQARKATRPTQPAQTAADKVTEAAREVTGQTREERDKAAAVLADWAALLTEDSYAATGPQAGVRIDVEKSVPGPIRAFVDRSYEAWAAEIEVDGRKLAAETPKWQHKSFADSTTAAEFIRLCQYYAKYRPAGRITVRGTTLKADPNTVRIAATPFTAKPRKG